MVGLSTLRFINSKRRIKYLQNFSLFFFLLCYIYSNFSICTLISSDVIWYSHVSNWLGTCILICHFVLKQVFVGPTNKADLDRKDISVQKAGTRRKCIAYDEELYALCMRRFLYIRCYDSFEFLSTLKVNIFSTYNYVECFFQQRKRKCIYS